MGVINAIQWILDEEPQFDSGTLTRSFLGESCDDPLRQEHSVYYIVDIRSEWSAQKYVTFWKPNSAGYTWPLSWAGKFTVETLLGEWNYYNTPDQSRFAVSCEDVESLCLAEPATGDIDGDAGPVLLNTNSNRRKLLDMSARKDYLEQLLETKQK
jgi:hypothetical protein